MANFTEQDEQLLLKYREYKVKKRRKIFLSALFLFAILLISLFLFYSFFIKKEEPLPENPIDKKPPQLQLTVKEVEILQNDTIDYATYIKEVFDEKDGNLLEKVKHTKIDTSKLGNQFIIYKVEDKAGNKSIKKLKVIINEKKEEQKKEEVPIPPKVEEIEPVLPTPQPQPPKQPPKVNYEPIFFYLGENGYDTLNIESACITKANELGGGVCSVLVDGNGNAIGMKLTVK